LCVLISDYFSSFGCYFQFIRYTELYKTLLEKSEELQIKLADEKEDSKAAFIQAKQNFEDIGMEASRCAGMDDIVVESSFVDFDIMYVDV